MKVFLMLVLCACALLEVTAQCSTPATTIPSNKRKKVNTQRNKWHTACLNVMPLNTCVWNFKRKKCVPFPGCPGLMRGTCLETSTCHWKPHQTRKNWKYKNWKARRGGKCVTNPPGWNPELCQYKYKTQCQKASQCRYNNPKLAGNPNKCSLKPGHSEDITGTAAPTKQPTKTPTNSPTIACNPNTCNGLVCADDPGVCQVTGDWGSCGNDWDNRKYCPKGWARCLNGKCVNGNNNGCNDFGGLDIGFQAC